MNQSNRPPALSLERAASLERLARARFFAYNQKRTMPPRINPVGILLLILTAGIIFVGLTITIVANWPGLASVGENRLKIAGPIILCLGFLACVATAIFMCLWVSKQNKTWERDMTEKAHKFINSSQSQEPLVDGYSYPNNPINDRKPGEHKMVPSDQRSDRQKNPSNRKPSSPNGSDSFESYTFETEGIPNPIRIQKKHQIVSNKGANNSKGSSNQSFSAGEGDMSIPGVSFGSPRGSIQPTNGFGKRSPGEISPIHSNNNEIERYKRTIKTTTTTSKTVISSEKNRKVHDKTEDPIRYALDRGRASHDRPNEGLRVLIKAQPNTAVHITPSSTPPTGGHPIRISMDTEI